jgi:hypothetical protein
LEAGTLRNICILETAPCEKSFAGQTREADPIFAGGRPMMPWNRREELIDCSGRRQPSVSGTSRISREAYVRFCEGLEVQFLGPTRQVAQALLKLQLGKAAKRNET